MRLLLFFIFLISFAGTYSQGDSIVISGKVITEVTNEPVIAAKLVISCSDGSVREVKTDENGNYYLKIPRKIGSVQLKSQASKETHLKNNGLDVLEAPNESINLILSSPGNFKKDFYFKKTERSLCLPELLFRLNSEKPLYKVAGCRDSILSEEAIIIFEKILIDNPAIIIEISGNASTNETNPQGISLKRAEYVKKELQKKGINSQRMKCKGFGIKQPIVPNEIINNARTPQEKIMLHQKNRRVTLRILSFDFEDSKKGNEKNNTEK